MRKSFGSAWLPKIFGFVVMLTAAYGCIAQESQPFSINTSPLPAPTGFVNDFAGVIDPATKQQLEAKLKNLKETSNPTVEIAVAVVKTTGDRPIYDYSLAVARGWKIGSKLDDNPGALLFIAIDDRKYFTQVSKDLEDELPDGTVGSLQRQYLVPEFRSGNYGKGISDTIDAYIAAIRNKGNAVTATPTRPVQPTRGSGSSTPSGLFCCAIVVIGFIILLIFAKSQGGRGGGSGGGGLAGNIASGVLGGLIGNALGGGSSGGGSDWGGSSGGGSDWGGFSGGGDFGGGGSGGDW